jgi:RNA polymerase sigma-70 factor (ECF subfamily)
MPDAREAAWLTGFEEGRRRWPHIELGLESFLAAARDAGLAEAPLVGEAAADAFLAYACARALPRALALFEELLVPGARRAVSKVDAEDAFVQDTLQIFRQKFLVGPPPGLAAFNGRAPLRVWLKVAATRLAIDGVRARRPAETPLESLEDRLVAGGLDPDWKVLRDAHGEAFRSALAAALEELSSRDRTLLRLHFLDGLGIDRLAAPYGVHRATVARWLQTAREQIAVAVRRELGRRFPDLEGAAIESLWRAVRSQLDLSFGSLLEAAGPEREAVPSVQADQRG